MVRLPAELIDAVVQRQAVLFVGAGVSATLGVPTFDQLVATLAGAVGYDPDLFRLHGDAPTLADFVKRELTVEEFERLIARLAERFKRSDTAISHSSVHRLIR